MRDKLFLGFLGKRNSSFPGQGAAVASRELQLGAGEMGHCYHAQEAKKRKGEVGS